MITSMHIENFKCFKDFNIDLGPFNVLIGPNDSGKTAFMQAVRLVGAFDSCRDRDRIATQDDKYLSWLVFNKNAKIKKLGFDFGNEFYWRCEPSNKIKITIDASVCQDGNKEKRRFYLASNYEKSANNFSFNFNKSDCKKLPLKWFSDAIGNIKYYRFDALKLRELSPLKKTMDETGDGFVAFLDKINREKPDAYRSLRQEFSNKFPYYKDLSLPLSERVKEDAAELKFHTVHNEILPADSVSDGVMLSLAYMALSHQPDPPKILLIEEPENGVHHGSLDQIVKTLRSLAEEKNVQIIMTTHSPHLVDCVKPEEVYVFHKDNEGAVHTKKLTCYPDLENLKKHFRAGEIWTGFKEADLFKEQGAAK